MNETIAELLPEQLASERLILRSWRLEDAPTMHRLCDDPEIRQWAGLPVPFTADDVAQHITGTLPADRAAGRRLSYAVTVAATGAVLGNVGLHAIQPRGAQSPGSAAVSVWLGADDRGMGFAREAVGRLVAGAFDTLALDRIVCHLLAGNEAGRRLARSLGFVVDSTLRAAAISDGAPADVWYGDLLPHELVREGSAVSAR